MPTIVKDKKKVKGPAPLPVASLGEIQALKEKIGREEATKALATGTAVDPEIAEAGLPVSKAGVEFDVGAVDRRIARHKRALAALDPAQRVLTGAERQKGEKRYAELSEQLPGRMLTREEMDYFPSPGDPQKDQAYRQAVAKACSAQGENSPGFIALAQEWKQLGRLLWPEDPEKSNLETLRAHGPTSGRHFRR